MNGRKRAFAWHHHQRTALFNGHISGALNQVITGAGRARRERAALFNDIDALVEAVVTQAAPLDRIVVMSNGGFEGGHERLLDALTAREQSK